MTGEWYRVGKRAEIAAPKGCRVQVGSRWVAVHEHEGRIYAVDDSCPHRGASLASGLVTDDGYVECAHHGWQYQLATGRGREAWNGCIDAFAVEDRDGEIFVRTKDRTGSGEDL